tara:strand:- start:1089 stop:1865 length:777 start_codon:yes stop_codon:yes gene_type:complete
VKKAVRFSIAVLLASASQAGDRLETPTAKNARSIIHAIQSGADLSSTGLALLLDEVELAELAHLKGCSASLGEEIRTNLVIYNWECSDSPIGVEGGEELKRTTTLRFQDDGALFALAVNPTKASFAPTEAGLTIEKVPSRDEMAENFSNAVISGEDATLGGVIPLTASQVRQLDSYAGATFNIIKPMSRRERRKAREVIGPRATFYERPQDGIDLTLKMDRARGNEDKHVTLYFDRNNLPIGVHIESSLLAIAPLPDR